jgi:hypothetical protein
MPKQVTSFPHGNCQKKSADVQDSAEGMVETKETDKVINGSKRALQTPHGKDGTTNRPSTEFTVRIIHDSNAGGRPAMY